MKHRDSKRGVRAPRTPRLRRLKRLAPGKITLGNESPLRSQPEVTHVGDAYVKDTYVHDDTADYDEGAQQRFLCALLIMRVQTLSFPAYLPLDPAPTLAQRLLQRSFLCHRASRWLNAQVFW